ncbi:MAG TPA: hypothetical protein VFX70_02885 [Mycobacteriales bacterium]|nr:hypothetical protein [Mycobacteriales bacterium]
MARAAGLLAGAPVRIAVLPAGSGPASDYPSAASWELVLRALVGQHPEALVCLVGKLGRDERTATGFGRAGFDRLRRAVPRAVDVLDAPIADQLAAVAGCDVFVSPHSGFADGGAGGGHAVAVPGRQPLAGVLLQRGAVLFGAARHRTVSLLHRPGS